MTEEDIVSMIQKDAWMMDVLKEAEKLGLPEWMIGAGFLRNKVWDLLHGFGRAVADTRDVDLVYFDPHDPDEAKDIEMSKRMNGVLGLEWEIVNQAYTHAWHDRKIPYKSAAEALSEWVETATCVAVTLQQGKPLIIAPHGIDDLIGLIVRPSPTQKSLNDFYSRIQSKKWLQKWPKLKVMTI